MTTSSTISPALWTSSFPDEALAHVYSFFQPDPSSSSRVEDNKTIIAASRVCKAWHANTYLSQERNLALKMTKQPIHQSEVNQEIFEISHYPEEIRKVFMQCNTPIHSLPKLDLGDETGSTGYIDFVKPADMSHPVMKFTDALGRPGIAFHLQKMDEDPMLRIDGVVTVFRRHSESDSNTWVIGDRSQIRTRYFLTHNSEVPGHALLECPTCPFLGGIPSPLLIRNWLIGQDALCKLAEPRAPPAIELELPQEQQGVFEESLEEMPPLEELPARRSICNNICTIQ
jgi:hypothetical protein